MRSIVQAQWPKQSTQPKSIFIHCNGTTTVCVHRQQTDCSFQLMFEYVAFYLFVYTFMR